MEIICKHCSVHFCQLNHRTKRMRFCTKQCAQSSQYYKHKDYYQNRYEQQKLRLLEMGRAYREREDVKVKRKGYQESYRDSDRERARERRRDPLERAANSARHKASKILLAVSPKICCHCDSSEKVQCHHVDEDPTNNAITNLAWLCRPHHDLYHAMVRPEVRAEIARSIRRFQLLLPTSERSTGGFDPHRELSLSAPLNQHS